MSRKHKARSRREPTLGDLDHKDAPAPADDGLPRVHASRAGRRAPAERLPRPSRRPPHRSRSPLRSWLWPLLAVLLVAALVVAWLNQDRLRSWLPRTHINTMLIHADQALARGHLEGGNGTSAHELYARVLAQEPDNNHARRGLQQVGHAELARASSAIKAHDYPAARESIANARQLLGGGSDVHQVERELRTSRHPPKQVEATIDKARKAMAAGKVAGPDGAAALYRQVLQVQPDNSVARHGLDRAGDALVRRARQALDQGDVDQARSLVAELGKLLPRNGDLPSLRAKLARARKTHQADALQTRLDQGRKALKNGRFTGGDDSALAQFRAALKLDPGNADAQAGLRQVGDALVLRANAALDGHDVASAKKLLHQARQVAPKSAELAVARSRLASLEGHGPATVVSTTMPHADAAQGEAHPSLSASQKARIRTLVKRAHAAEAAGHIMLPPGASAYDLYRQALTIDGNSAKARAGLQKLPAIAIHRFDKALAGQQLERADGYLQTFRDLQPASDRADALSRKLANAWLDRAQAKLEQGHRDAARHALQAAHKLAPDAPRVRAFSRRLDGD